MNRPNRYKRYLWDSSCEQTPRSTLRNWSQRNVNVGVSNSDWKSSDNEAPVYSDSDGENMEEFTWDDAESDTEQNDECQFVIPPASEFEDRLEKSLYDGSTVTVGAAVALIMSFVYRHSITWIALQDLLSLLHLLFPNSEIPATRHLFNRYCIPGKTVVELHYYCPSCSSYIGQNAAALSCSMCSCTLNKELLKNSFFIIIPIENQLRDLLEKANLSEFIKHRSSLTKQEPNNIEDIYDGKLYKARPELKDERNFSLLWNADGVPVFKSSNCSLWPIQCAINELPYHLRKDHLLLAGLWFGKGKPNFNAFLKPFTEECNNLQTSGFKWLSRADGREHESKVFNLVCSCDAVARCQLQGIKQFNGEFGCSWCLNPGKIVPKGNGFVRVYEGASHHKLRTHDDVVRDARLVVFENVESVNGVKAASPLLVSLSFDIVFSFVVDYMHCVLLGVTRALSSLWFDSDHHQADWYLGLRVSQISDRLVSIRPHSKFNRAPRSLKERAFWKASEWRNWLLHYSLMCLCDELPSRFYKHYLLFVQSVTILLGDSISLFELNNADSMLQIFVIQFAAIYGESYMSYNVHQLLHVAESVRNWGPLWSHSAFMFENGNGTLMQLFNGTQQVPVQIANKFITFRTLPIMANKYLHDKHMFDFFVRAYKVYKRSKRAVVLPDGVTLYSTSILRNLSQNERALLDSTTPGRLPTALPFYKSVIVKGSLIRCSKYERSARRQNSCVSFGNNVCCIIRDFVLIDGTCYAICEKLSLTRKLLCDRGYMDDYNVEVATSHIWQVSKLDDHIVLQAKDIKSLCVFIPASEHFDMSVVCFLPNGKESD